MPVYLRAQLAATAIRVNICTAIDSRVTAQIGSRILRWTGPASKLH